MSQTSNLKPVLGSQLRTGHPLARGLVGYWLMNEGGGNKILDLSGNNNTGTFAGDTKWVPGKYGSCLSFDGAGDYVSMGDRDELIGENYSFSFWLNNAVTVTQYSGIISKLTTSTTPYNGIDILRNYAALRVYINLGTPAVSDGAFFSSADWTHGVVVLKGTSVSIYRNGRFIASGTFSGITDTDVPFILGTQNAIMSRCYTGLMDNVMIYNRSLSAAEVQQLYREPFAMFDKARVWGGVEAPPAGNAVFFGTEF